MKRVDPLQTQRARTLRNNATAAERSVWALLSSYRPRFTRQLPIGPYIVDLACRRARLIVELDGSQHLDSAADEGRTAFLEGQGWTVIRFWNNEVAENLAGVAEAILLKAAECLGGTHPLPLPKSREGRRKSPA
jgi:very-short-patch-repair endonuclease